MVVVPYVMLVELAKLAASIAEEHPEADGIVLANMAISLENDDAKSSYNRVIEQTNKVEEWFAARRIEPISYR